MPGEKKEAPVRPLLAAGAFLGTVIGVGIFGLPYIAAHIGFFPLVCLFVILTPAALLLHLRFADIVLGSTVTHGIPGYVREFLGARWQRMSLVVSALGLAGALLAYLIVGGTFVQMTFHPLIEFSPLAATLVFFLFGGWLIASGTRSVAFVDLVLMAVFFLVVLLFGTLAMPKIDFSVFHSHQFTEIPIGYGVALFSLWGLSIVPETVELGHKNRKAVRAVLIWGVMITAVVSLLFAAIVFGISRGATTQDALTGFLSGFAPWVSVAGGILGLAATFTSYIALGLVLQKTLLHDFHLPASSAIILTLVTPFAFYLIGIKNLIDVLGITGAVLLGFEGILILAVSEVFRRQKGQKGIANTLLVILLFLGIAAEVWGFLRK